MKFVLGNWHLNAIIWHFKRRHLVFMKWTPGWEALNYLVNAFSQSLKPVHVNDCCGDCYNHAENSRTQAATAADFYLKKEPSFWLWNIDKKTANFWIIYIQFQLKIDDNSSLGRNLEHQICNLQQCLMTKYYFHITNYLPRAPAFTGEGLLLWTRYSGPAQIILF